MLFCGVLCSHRGKCVLLLHMFCLSAVSGRGNHMVVLKNTIRKTGVMTFCVSAGMKYQIHAVNKQPDL